MPTRIPAAAWAELSALALIWGTSFLALKIALAEAGVLTVVFWRVAIAAALLWAVVLLRGERPRLDRGLLLALGVMGLVNNAIPFALLSWGQLHIETGLAAILNATSAIFGAVAAALFIPAERLTPSRAVGVALGFAGVVAMIGPEALRGLDLRSLAQGAVLGASLAYALGSVWGRLRLRGQPPDLAAAGMLTAATLAIAPLALAADGPPSLALSAQAWGAILWLSGVGTAAAYLSYYRVLARVGAGNVLLVTLMIPPVAVAIGALVLGERLGAEAKLGYGLLALGLAVIDGRLVGWAGAAGRRMMGGGRGA